MKQSKFLKFNMPMLLSLAAWYFLLHSVTSFHSVSGSKGSDHCPSWSWFHVTVYILQRNIFWCVRWAERQSWSVLKQNKATDFLIGLFFFFSQVVSVFSTFYHWCCSCCFLTIFLSMIFAVLTTDIPVVGEERYFSLLGCPLTHYLIFLHSKESIAIWCLYWAFIEFLSFVVCLWGICWYLLYMKIQLELLPLNPSV